MAVSMTAFWNNMGTVIPGGDAEYVVAEQPIAEYDNWFNYNIVADIQAVIDDVINRFDANTILKADTDNTPAALVVAEQTIVGRKTGSSIAALTAAEVRTVLNVEDGSTADQTNTEIRDAVEAATDSNTFTDADHTKLNGVSTGADVTANNPPQAHNQSATTITSGILAIAQGGTGVSGDTYDARYVNGCDTGDLTGDVYKVASTGNGVVLQYSSAGIQQLLPGTNGYQLTSNGIGNLVSWSSASDLIFSDKVCPKCGAEFQDGEILVLYLVGHNEVGDILTIPMHNSCAKMPKRTVLVKRKVMENKYVLDELTGEPMIQRVVKTRVKIVTKHKLKEGYIIDHKSGKAHKFDKDGNVDNTNCLLSDATETIEETIREIVYEDVEFEL